MNVSTSPIWLKNGTSVSRTNRRSSETTACTVSNVPSVEHHDHRLLGGGEVADDRDHADHERPLRRVRDEGLLAVEQRHLGRLQHVRAAIALSGFDQEEHFDVAQDREAEGGADVGSNPPNCGVGEAEAALPERQVQVGREVR